MFGKGEFILAVIFIQFVSNGDTAIRETSFPVGNSSQPSANRTARTFYGLLGLLAGFPQGYHDTDYGAADATLPDGWPSLHVLHKRIKYPLLLSLLPPPHSPQYPPQYFRPFWYPPVIVIPSSSGPVNQQQIINLHELLSSDNDLNDNYQEMNNDNVQTINNNIRPRKSNNDTENDETSERVSNKTTTEKPTTAADTTSTTMKITTKTTTSTSAIETTTVTDHDVTQTNPYPYPPSNTSNLNHISLTTITYDKEDAMRFPYHDINNAMSEYYQALPEVYSPAQHDQFYPMGGNFYDFQNERIDKSRSKYHKLQNEADFSPALN